MLEIIQTWLAKPSGRYFDGLAIFLLLAGAEIKKKYEVFFSEVKEEPAQFDIHFTMLVNKVAAIESAVKINPKAFEGIELVLKATGPDVETQALLDAKNAEIAELTTVAAEKATEVETLKEKLDALKLETSEVTGENEELSEKIEELETEIEDAEDEISDNKEKVETLESEIAELKAKRGIQIIPFKDLPADLQKMYSRVQEITPLMAKIHAEIAVESISATKRKGLVKKLCDLDDERRSAWDAIDAWSEGKNVTDVPVQKEELAYDVDPLIAGAQMLRRILKLKENIKNSKMILETSEREVLKENAQKRIAAYELELAELEAKTKPEVKESDVE